ncbi:MAG: hypothetical protein AAF213_10895 [Pseudomonadota bacterium]
MIRKLATLFTTTGATTAGTAEAGREAPGPDQGAREAEDHAIDGSPMPMATRLAVLDRDPYLYLADLSERVISVFDDLKYDRADLDMMSGPMRERLMMQLKPLGFRQVSGMIMENKAEDLRVIFPKFHALGASPFDIARYTTRRGQDYLALTPTQTACHYIDHYDHGEAVDRVKALVIKQPINLFRLMDYLEDKPAHRAFQNAIGHIKLVQREAVEAAPLKTRRALGSMGI